jgi:hypothetical protein
MDIDRIIDQYCRENKVDFPKIQRAFIKHALSFPELASFCGPRSGKSFCMKHAERLMVRIHETVPHSELPGSKSLSEIIQSNEYRALSPQDKEHLLHSLGME